MIQPACLPVARTLFVWGGPASGVQNYRARNSFRAKNIGDSRKIVTQPPSKSYPTSLRFIPRNVLAVLTLLFRTRSRRATVCPTDGRTDGVRRVHFTGFAPRRRRKKEEEERKKRKTTESLERQ